MKIAAFLGLKYIALNLIIHFVQALLERLESRKNKNTRQVHLFEANQESHDH
mgnify:CR=1 FL=1|jgi:hypothetical protein